MRCLPHSKKTPFGIDAETNRVATASRFHFPRRAAHGCPAPTHGPRIHSFPHSLHPHGRSDSCSPLRSDSPTWRVLQGRYRTVLLGQHPVDHSRIHPRSCSRHLDSCQQAILTYPTRLGCPSVATAALGAIDHGFPRALPLASPYERPVADRAHLRGEVSFLTPLGHGSCAGRLFACRFFDRANIPHEHLLDVSVILFAVDIRERIIAQLLALHR